jgi:Ca2+-binding RTX toxin-like protein
MSIFLGSNKGETITPDSVSSSVVVVGQPKKPSAAADIIFAGGGDDIVAGGGGNDIVSLGSGNDTFIWNGGDGNDIVTGDGGYDTLKFNGADLDEDVEIGSLLGAATIKGSVSIGGQKLSSTLLLNSMERLDVATLGGADRINIRGLSGTDVKEVAVDLGVNGAGDGAIDRVSADATSKADTVKIGDDANGVKVTGLPAAVAIAHADANDVLAINGGAGNDTIDASGLSADRMQLEILGGDGNDTMTGSAGGDLIVGGRGDDVAYMSAGDDTFLWNPGEGSDIVEGGAGFDEMLFNGNGASENIDIRANGERITFFRDVAAITMDLNEVEQSTFNALGGKDTVVVHALDPFVPHAVKIDLAGELLGVTGDGAEDAIVVEDNDQFDLLNLSGTLGSFSVTAGNTFVEVRNAEAQDHLTVKAGNGDDSVDASTFVTGGLDLTLDGGAGNDFILGANGVETVFGGDGDDVVDGNRGDDTAFLGAGDDIFVWDPGEGSDVVEGGEGFDKMLFNGANANEPVEISANGERARFFRQPGNITMDLNEVEIIEFQALGGTDDITIRDLTGTDVQQIDISLAGAPLGTTPDGQLDTVTIEATNDQDFIDVFGSAESVAILGAGPAFVTVDRFDATDRLTIKGGAGDDQISASSQTASMQMTLDGGAGDDTIFGSGGADTLIGGDGDDFIDGNRGDDVAFLGAGDDIFVWDPGEGSDTIEGGEGWDFMGFRGANAAENVNITANGERVTFFRDVASITMDLNDVESTTFNAFGGVDNINIGDLTGTDLERIELSLIGGSGTPNDGLQDSVTIAGSAQSDAVIVSTANLLTQIDGLHAQVQITGADAGLDRLQIDTGAGDDAVDASALQANLFQFGVTLGDGNDAFIGSAGKDVVDGGDGFDVLSGEDGNDVLDGGAGIDILTGGAGDDLFANGEIIQDFIAGAGSEDRIDLRGFGASFDWVMEHATDTDAGVLFDFDGAQMLLGGVAASSLHQDDFLLA